MPRNDEDEAWRAIVENYGDRAELAPEDTAHESSADPDPAPRAVREPDPFALPAELTIGRDSEERFQPPPPPPLPHVPRDRMLAWVGLFGSPTILLISLVLGIHLPSIIGYLLVAAFLGGFGYLVWQMPRGPHDPWDDGARL